MRGMNGSSSGILDEATSESTNLDHWQKLVCLPDGDDAAAEAGGGINGPMRAVARLQGVGERPAADAALGFRRIVCRV